MRATDNDGKSQGTVLNATKQASTCLSDKGTCPHQRGQRKEAPWRAGEEHSRGTASAKALWAHGLWGVERGPRCKCGDSLGRGVRWSEVRREDRQAISDFSSSFIIIVCQTQAVCILKSSLRNDVGMDRRTTRGGKA